MPDRQSCFFLATRMPTTAKMAMAATSEPLSARVDVTATGAMSGPAAIERVESTKLEPITSPIAISR